MPSWSHITFEGKHADEKILHFARPSKKQTIFEISRIIIPVMLIIIIFSVLFSKDIIWWGIFLITITSFIIGSAVAVMYKIYRTNRNYMYVTSKRILFHWIEWLFNDYMKKVAYENIVNVNYFTDSLLWRIFWYWTIQIQTAHSWLWDIMIYNIEYWKMITLYIDKIISLPNEERASFNEFDVRYFKDWKK